ncbi:MAG: type II toxin-antitoxin system VapC family toxin [Sandaracinaceae bacterium]
MRLLLDTHVFLWWRADAPELAAGAREAILDTSTEVYVSAAVAWEIVIKRALGKLDFEGAVADAVREEGFTPLGVSLEHVDAVARLEPHHRDPFDRLLVAQARVEGLTLVTVDPLVRAYAGVALL